MSATASLPDTVFDVTFSSPDTAAADLLRHHHALYRLLPPPQQARLLDFGARVLAVRDISLTQPESRLDLMVAAGAALVGMYQPVDYFSSIDWIYLGEPDTGHDGEAWGSTRLLLDSSTVIEESEQIIPGCQVVVHEFAHVLDQMLGLSGRTDAIRRALETHLETLDRGAGSCISDWRDSIPIESVFDGDFRYLEQVEFFAYAGEAFFTAPVALRAELPGLYEELLAIYRIDMAALTAAADHS